LLNFTNYDYWMLQEAGEERARLWAALVANYRDYARYERKTRGTRELPVVVLERIA